VDAANSVNPRPSKWLSTPGALSKRPAQPAELAPTYVFLASPDSRYHTGEVLAPTGFQTTTR
jgi:NAD(P)-dependent dehydrogenase (short-subunit alcohol dehydrogenase family)